MSKQEGNSGEFEQSWKSAFSGEEVTPPSRIWSEIDHGLTQTELVGLKHKTVVYKWTAAAAIIVAASLGVLAISFNYAQIVSIFGLDEGGKSKTVTAKEVDNDPAHVGNYAGFSILRNEFDQVTGKEESNPSPNPVITTQAVDQTPVILTNKERRSVYSQLKSQSVMASADDLSIPPVNIFPELSRPGISRPSFGYLTGVPTENVLTTKTADPSSFGVNGVMVNEVHRPVLNAPGKTRFWSGVDVASGYFSPNYRPGSTITSQEELIKGVAARQSIPELSENMSGGASYSIGINFGMEMNEKWSIETGVLYSLLGARTFTNLILESEGFNNAVAYSSEISGLETVANLVESELTKLSVDDIQITNTFQFISLPVQVGYRLLDKRVNVTINAGLAANIYLGNSLRGQQNFRSFEIEPGRRSPYRSLTLAGVAGFEIGYRIHRRVNFSFEPTFQQNLQSLTKDDASFIANPSGVGLQMGFKYDF